MAITQDGLAHRQLKSAVSTHKIQATAVRIEVRAFDHEPVQITRETRQEGKDDSGSPDLVVTGSFEARLRHIVKRKVFTNCADRMVEATRRLPCIKRREHADAARSGQAVMSKSRRGEPVDEQQCSFDSSAIQSEIAGFHHR